MVSVLRSHFSMQLHLEHCYPVEMCEVVNKIGNEKLYSFFHVNFIGDLLYKK